MKRYALLALSCFIISAVIAVWKVPRTFSAKPKKVVLLVRTGAEADGLRKVAESYTKETGTPVEVVEVGRAGYFTTMPTKLLAGTDAFDVVFFPSTMVAQFAEAGAIATIDPFIKNKKLTDEKVFDIKDFLAVYRYKGKLYALPSDVSTHFLYYRQDLIKTPPQTWDEYLKLAKKFTKKYNPKSPTNYGGAMTCLAPEELPKVFYSVMWSFGGSIVDAKGKVGVDNAGAVAAGKLYQALSRDKLIAPDILTWGFPEVKTALLSGKVAMAAPYWNAAYAMILADKGPYAKKIKAALVPGVKKPDGKIYRTPFQHGWTLVLNANSKNKNEAWKFLAYATGKEGGKVHARAGGTPARLSVLSDASLQKLRPDFKLMVDSLKIAKDEPAVPFYSQMHEVMNVALTVILSGKQTPDKALKDAANKIRSLQKKSK